MTIPAPIRIFATLLIPLILPRVESSAMGGPHHGRAACPYAASFKAKNFES
jgi:hypothetical protein